VSLWADEDIPQFKVNWEREFWVTDPGPFTPICFDHGVSNFVFRGKWLDMRNMRQDFRTFIDIYARGRAWRLLYVPYPDREAVLFTSDKGFDEAEAIWPVWRSDIDKWDAMLDLWDRDQNNGAMRSRLGFESTEQEHRVIVAGYPNRDGEWVQIATRLQGLQVEDPNKTIHSHGQKSVGRTIGIGVKSFDHHVRLGWDDGFPRVLLPNGMQWRTANGRPSRAMEHWLNIVGASYEEYKRNERLGRKELSAYVYSVNLRSLRWAFLNWERAWDFRRSSADAEDMESAETDFDPSTVKVRINRAKGELGRLDKWLCDTCSAQFRCPYSREGAVCIVPDSEPAELAELFGTRNSAQIVQGLQNILAAQSRRANSALKTEIERSAQEDENGNPIGYVLDPALTRLFNTLFDRGLQMAKLVDPRIAAQMGPKIGVNILNVGGGATGVGMSGVTPQALMSGVAAELEARGIRLEDATPEMVQGILIESSGGSLIEASTSGED
jgi:hypothetical protein